MFKFLPKKQTKGSVDVPLSDIDKQNCIRLFGDSLRKEMVFAVDSTQQHHNKYAPVSIINRDISLFEFIESRFDSFEKLQEYVTVRNQDIVGFSVLYTFFEEESLASKCDTNHITNSELSTIISTLVSATDPEKDIVLIRMLGEASFIEKLCELSNKISKVIIEKIKDTSDLNDKKAKLIDIFNLPQEVMERKINSFIDDLYAQPKEPRQVEFENVKTEEKSLGNIWNTLATATATSTTDDKSTPTVSTDLPETEDYQTEEKEDVTQMPEPVVVPKSTPKDNPNLIDKNKLFDQMFTDISILDQSVQEEIRQLFDENKMNNAIVRYADALHDRKKALKQKLDEVLNGIAEIDNQAKSAKDKMNKELEVIKEQIAKQFRTRTIEVDMEIINKKIEYFSEHLSEISEVIDESPISIESLQAQKEELEKELDSLK